jgi:NosR/NirI family transcriptional regulator, nitrous oxide reductase regulator
LPTSWCKQLLVFCVLFGAGCAWGAGLLVSPAKAPEPFIDAAFVDATRIAQKTGSPPVWTAYQDDQVIGYAFETDDVSRIPAYSGEPVNMLVAIDNAGTILSVNVLEHHEPILLVGIPEKKLFTFTDQYAGFSVNERIKIGGRPGDGMSHIDGLSGATVTVMVMNLAVMRSVTKVARAKGIISADKQPQMPKASVNDAVFNVADWPALTGDGSIRRLRLSEGDVEAAFAGTAAAAEKPLTDEQADGAFADIYYTQLDIPSVGKNLLGESEFAWLKDTLKPGEHAIALMGNGFSFKGSGYVRGGIFDRIQIHQGENEFNFRDVDHYRINDLYAEGTPRLREMSIFIVREHHEFDPGSPWQLELLVRRQTGPVDSVFTSFKADYEPLDQYLIRPEPSAAEEELALWEQVWNDHDLSIKILVFSMVLLLIVLFLQDWLVLYPRFLHNFRRVFLVYTVVFVGIYSMGQLSVVNVFTFVQALMDNFNWELFLLDPVIFVLWVFVAVSVLLWGRGIYCGWLCPFGALQELLSELAVKLKVPQLTIPFALHERLWAVKYLVLLALFGLSLESLSTAEQFAEVEPFKTTFLLRFDRDWPFITYVLGILFVSLFSRKVYCRYVCPLGAAIAIASGMRLFDWLKRRKECGQPCRVCANECEIGAIEPSGKINLRECHHCLDCQVTYKNKDKCPPLIKKYRRKPRSMVEDEAIRLVDSVSACNEEAV